MMKKLLLMFLVLTGMVSTASAGNLTVYMKAGDWNTDSPKFAVWAWKDGGADSQYFDFTYLNDDYFYVELDDAYVGGIFFRYDSEQASWGGGTSWKDTGYWNKTGDIAFSSTANYFIFDAWNVAGVSTFTSSVAHKIYVRNMDDADQVVKLYRMNGDWSGINTWPGDDMTPETIDGKKWYSYLSLGVTSVLGIFTTADGDNQSTGALTCDLSSSDQYYNYYPSHYQAVATAEALATPAKAYFRVTDGKDGESIKWYTWDDAGINTKKFLPTTETVGTVEWLMFETYKPDFSIQFYTFNNGDAEAENDKCYGKHLHFNAGESTYYYTSLPRKNIAQYAPSYSIAYWTDDSWLANNKDVGTFDMVADGDFQFKGTIDNTAGERVRYCITPTSNISAGKLVEGNEAITYKGGTFDINNFEAHENYDAIPNRWSAMCINNVAAKFDVTFNFATMKWSSKPHVTTTVSAAGYATYSKGAMYNIGAADAYVVETVNTGSVKMTQLPENTILPANAGIILAGTGDHEIYAAVWDAAARDNSANKLVGTGDGTATLDGTKKEYVLGNGASGIGFYKAAAGELGANKAYLNLEGVEAPDFLGFDDATGISEINAETNLFGGAPIYNLQGVKLSKFQKGLNIVNGNKIIVQ